MAQPAPETRERLAGIRAFGELEPELLDAMWAQMEERSFRPGEALMHQADPGDCLLVLLEGTAEVSATDPEGVKHAIASVGAGEVVGEMALITGERRGADVVAREQVRALALAASEFDRLARRHPALGIVLTHLVADRLGRADWDALGGKTVRGHRILRCVGRGGMAVVYEAQETASGRRVALKMMSHRLVYDPAALARFRQEAEIVEKLDHANIARLFGRFSAFGTHFLVMEFLDGLALDKLLARTRQLPETQVRRIVGQLSAALGYIHDLGLLHRDVKPGNVMLTRDGLVKLMDFGLVKPLENLDERTVTHELTLVGTPSYMAPEQMGTEELDSRADIYALACLTLSLLTGAPIFKGSSLLDLVRQKLSFALPDPERIGAGVSAEMYDFLRRGLDSSRERRLASLEPYRGWAAPVDLASLGL